MSVGGIPAHTTWSPLVTQKMGVAMFNGQATMVGGWGSRRWVWQRTMLSHSLSCGVHFDGHPGTLMEVLTVEMLPPYAPVCLADLGRRRGRGHVRDSIPYGLPTCGHKCVHGGEMH